MHMFDFIDVELERKIGEDEGTLFGKGRPKQAMDTAPQGPTRPRAILACSQPRPNRPQRRTSAALVSHAAKPIRQ